MPTPRDGERWVLQTPREDRNSTEMRDSCPGGCARRLGMSLALPNSGRLPRMSQVSGRVHRSCGPTRVKLLLAI